MTHYLIEFRFFGKAKKDAKSLIWEVNKRFHIRPFFRPVPHVTLVGSLTTKEQGRLINDFKRVCEKQGIIKYGITGYNTFENTRVVFIDIKPDQIMDEFRWELSKKLQPYCRLSDYDLERNFKFHATIAMKLNPYKFNNIKQYIKSKPRPNFKHILLRATLLRNSKILYEYDFLQRRLLNRREAKSRRIYNQTLEKLKQFFDGKYNPQEYIDFPEKENLTITDRIIGMFKKKRTFVIGDLHLDHANIIKYCNRPFKSVYEMNNALIDNWNKTVGKFDIVYYLGDLAFGKGSRNTDYWLKKLNGKIIFIKGSHDNSNKIKFYQNMVLEYHHNKFYLVHDPTDVPKSWNGWVIHGHHHNNKIEYPLVSKKNKTINVSAELLDYKPIEIEEIIIMSQE